MPQFKSGPDNPRWNEGQILHTEKGYRKLRVGKDHPLADRHGYAYEHLVIWVGAGNARPEKGFLIHHRNAIKTDNRIENLELVAWRDHTDHHNAAAVSALNDGSGYRRPKRGGAEKPDDIPYT